MSLALSNIRAVVTGGASGIGRAIAQELSARGSRVIVADINENGLTETLMSLNEGCSSYVCNISSHDEVEALAAYTKQRLGGCDLLFANAGVIVAGRYTKMTVAEVDWILSVNVRGVWDTTATFARMMEQQAEGGRICFTGSEHSLGFQHANAAVYTASKHAVLGLAEVLRAEVSDKLSVSIFCPGLVGTALGSGARPEGLPVPERNLDMSARIQARGMSVSEAARDAVDGTLRGDFYIVTHSHTVRAAERRLAEMRDAFAQQAQWERNTDRYDVNSVLKAVAAEMKAEGK